MQLTLRRFVLLIGLSISLLAGTSLLGRSLPSSIFVRATLETLAVLALAWLPGQALLWHLRPEGLDDEDLLILAIPTTLLAYLALGIPLLWLGAPAFVFKLVFFPVVAFSLFVLWRRLRAGPLSVPRSLPFCYLLACCGICFICVGMGSPWKIMDWTMPARRGLHDMPVDNALQHWTAMVFVDGTPPWTVPGWTMGDRPPLLGLITSLFAKAFLFRRLRYFDYTIIGIVLNSAYVIPLIRYMRRFQVSERAALLSTVSVVLAPAAFLNTYFTWPKLFGAMYSLAVLALFTRRPAQDPWHWTTLRSATVVGALLGASTLAHGGSLLSIPLVLVLLMLFGSEVSAQNGESATERSRPALRRTASGSIIVAGCVLLLQASWGIYKRAHPEINTNRLAYHYWPDRGVPGPIEIHELVPLNEWLAASPINEQLVERWGQVERTATSGQFVEVFRAVFLGELAAFNAQRWPFEMFRPVSQVGELRILLGALVCLVLLVRWFSAKAWGGVWRAELDWRPLAGTFIAAAISYFLNAFLKWRTIAPHELPLVELIVVETVLTLPVLHFCRSFSVVLLGFSLQRFFAYVAATTFARNLPMDLFASCVFASVLGMLWLALDRVAGHNKDTQGSREHEGEAKFHGPRSSLGSSCA